MSRERRIYICPNCGQNSLQNGVCLYCGSPLMSMGKDIDLHHLILEALGKILSRMKVKK